MRVNLDYELRHQIYEKAFEDLSVAPKNTKLINPIEVTFDFLLHINGGSMLYSISISRVIAELIQTAVCCTLPTSDHSMFFESFN